MNPFTDAELLYLSSQRLARIATASRSGEPDVAVVGFEVDGPQVLTGGFDISRTIRYGNLLKNPRVSLVVDDVASTEPWSPRGLKVRGSGVIEEHHGALLRIRITPEEIWSWGINTDQPKRFRTIERRKVSLT